MAEKTRSGEPVRPDYEGACVSGLVRALRDRKGPFALPAAVEGAETVVLFVLDGLGWTALRSRADVAPTLASLEGSAITTVFPSTTAVALTSLSTGRAPADHGIVGYRMRVGPTVFNVLRWSAADKSYTPAPEVLQPSLPFGGDALPVVTRKEYKKTPFTEAHLRGARFIGWSTPATIVEHVLRLVAEREPFVYAYYDGLDVIGHENGIEDGFIRRELAFVDGLVGQFLEALPARAALVVTSDHGHLHHGSEGLVHLDELKPMVSAWGGDARCRFVYARPGRAADLLAACEERHGARAWVLSRERICDERWLGPHPPSRHIAERVGDVVLAAREPVAFIEPTNPADARMLSGHGSLTADEMLVPLVAARGSR